MQPSLFTYFYFLSKYHQLAYFNMFMLSMFIILYIVLAVKVVGRISSKCNAKVFMFMTNSFFV